MWILQDFETVMTNKTHIVYAAGRDTLYVHRIALFCGKANYKLKSPFHSWRQNTLPSAPRAETYSHLSTLPTIMYSITSQDASRV